MQLENLPPGLVNAELWMTEHLPRLLKQIPHCRYYAMPYAARRALAATLAVWQYDRAQRLHAGFTDEPALKFLKEILPLFPGALQTWRPEQQTEMMQPEWWKPDAITGQLPINPHVKGAIQNETEREEVIKYLQAEYPKFDEHLRMVANGVNPVHLKRKHEKAEEDKVLRDFEYGEKQHRESALTRTSTETQRNEFLHPFPKAIQDVYLLEAKTGWTVPWHPTKEGRPYHVTGMGAITKAGFRPLIDEAREIEKQWAARDLEQIRASNEANKERQESAEALLAGKSWRQLAK